MFRSRIEEAIRRALAELGAGDVAFVVERPSSFEHGDYATNAAIAVFSSFAKQGRGEGKKVTTLDLGWTVRYVQKPSGNTGELKISSPKALAEFLQKRLEGEIPEVERIEVAGIGFLNFHLSFSALAQAVQKDSTSPEWGANALYLNQRVLVEYTDPNPFKEFHIGHLMSNAIGESIARLFEAGGADVKRANYQGDVGVHVAKAIWAKRQRADMSWGEAYVYGSEHYDGHKEEIDELNKVIYEKSDPEVIKLYDQGRKESLEHFEEIYKTLGTKFDYYFFESETGPLGIELVRKHPEIFETSDGAVIYRGENVGLHTRVFINSKGLPTYEAKELGLVVAKKKRGEFDLSLTVTANETRDFFKVVRAAAEKIFPDLEDKMLTRFHGFLKLTTGKMSSRLGNVITGESLIKDLTKEARNREDVAVGAIKYMVLRQNTGKDIVFDPERSLSLEGDSGPYVQYALVRARSLLRKAEEVQKVYQMPADPLKDGAEIVGLWNLYKILVHYPDVIARAVLELEPHYVATYLTELASAFNNWYATNRVIVENQVLMDRLIAARVVEKTLAKGLGVLGIPAPQEM